MKVLFLVQGKTMPSTLFRIYCYYRHLKRDGIDYKTIVIPKNFLTRIFIFLPILFYDLVFIQKKVFHVWELTLIRFLASKIVYDIDDAIMFIDKFEEERESERTLIEIKDFSEI